jgi:seryl-tRNA synthetase
MIDLRKLREDDAYRAGAVRKGVAPETVDAVLAADERHRALLQEVEELRRRQNEASKEIGRSAPEERQARIDAAGALKAALAAKEPELAEAAAQLRDLTLGIPNPAHESVPNGGEDDYEVIRVVGDQAPPPPSDHADYGERMGFVDSVRAVRMSGSRFTYLMREAVLLELALVQWVTQRLVRHGFVPVVPPVLVQEPMMEAAGFFPTDRGQVYDVDEGSLFLVGTSEVPLAGIHLGEQVPADSLPLRYAGISTCFRREAGTYGKDTRGLFRVHQFDKVEMFSYAAPDTSWDEHEFLLSIQESIVADLGLPYRVIAVAAGDLGAPAAKKYDIEAWLPSEGRYREVTSCSNYTDYSARRLGTRQRGQRGSELVHTLNGTACAVGRTLLFLFEHYQQPDGSLAVPEVLQGPSGLTTVPAR